MSLQANRKMIWTTMEKEKTIYQNRRNLSQVYNCATSNTSLHNSNIRNVWNDFWSGFDFIEISTLNLTADIARDKHQPKITADIARDIAQPYC